MNKLLLSVFVSICLFSFVSANGLVVLNSSYTISKTYGTDSVITINLQNQDSRDFYNISLDNSTGFAMTKINQLNAGQQISFPIIITKENSGVYNLRLKGFYYSNVGHNSVLYNVSVYAYNSNPCSFSLTQGDAIKFTSNLSNTISLRQFPSDVLVDGSTLLTGQSFTKTFTDLGTQGYQWFVNSWGFGVVCYITTLPQTGYINDPILDGVFNITLNVAYAPTNISLTVLQNNYTMNFFDSNEGLLSITNIGNSTAKNIALLADWLSFDINNFDLNVGSTKAVKYIISPKILNTSETNKSYTKTLQVTGNFLTKISDFNIFINYADINSSVQGNTTNFLTWVCTNYPDLCLPQTKYVYLTNGSDNGLKVNITQDQWRDYNLKQQELQEDLKTTLNIVKESSANSSGIVANINSRIDSIANSNSEAVNALQNQYQGIVTFLVIIFMAVIIISLFFGIRHFRTKNKQLRYNRW